MAADSMTVNAQVMSDIQVQRESRFTWMASAFARRNFAAITVGVWPDVELTLTGSSCLAGTYRGYEEFSQYVLGARLVLEPAGRPITYLHETDTMTVVHGFIVGQGAHAPEMPLHVVVRYGPDYRVASMVIEPRDQALFDEAVDAVLVRHERHSQAS